MWHLKYDTNKLNYETKPDSDLDNRVVVAKEKGEGGQWRDGAGRWDQQM